MIFSSHCARIVLEYYVYIHTQNSFVRSFVRSSVLDQKRMKIEKNHVRSKSSHRCSTSR